MIRAVTRRIEASAQALQHAHLEWNYASVAPRLQPGLRLLDLGAHDGKLAALLQARRGARPVCVDVTGRGAPGVPFVRFDGLRLPFRDAAFDAVTLLYVLHHARDDLAVLTEAARVLAPGGTLLVAEDLVEDAGQRLLTVGFHLWLRAVSGMGWEGQFRRTQHWEARFAEAGLRIRQVTELGPHLGRRLWPRNVLFELEHATR